MRWGVAIGCVLLFTWASSARASIAVVVPPTVDVATSPDNVDAAIAELTRMIRVHGFDVISPGQAEAAAEDAQASGSFASEQSPTDCRSAACATEYRRLLDASFAVQLRLVGTGGKIGGVTITITESPTASFSAMAIVQGGDLKGAIRSAYGTAREKHMRGEGPWLSAAGTPVGAVVYLDGQEYGSVPFERRYVEGGKHRVEVRHDGFITQGFQLEIPNAIDHEERLDVKLASLHATPLVERPLDRTWDYVVGAAFMAAGAVHLGMGIHQKVIAGACLKEYDNGHCRRERGTKSGLRENLLLGLGAGGIALGGIWMWAAPIGRLGVRADRNAASLTLSGGF